MIRCFFTLLLALFLAPACAPEKSVVEKFTSSHLVLLTDTLQWEAQRLEQYRDSLKTAGFRVLISGRSGETAPELKARLPWLLQPGVDLFIYDQRLAGKAGMDSLKSYLDFAGHPAETLALKP